MCFWRKAFQPRDHARGGLIMDRETVDSGAAFSRRRCVRRIRYGELWRRATRPDTRSYRPLPIFYPLITHTSSTRVTDASGHSEMAAPDPLYGEIQCVGGGSGRPSGRIVVGDHSPIRNRGSTRGSTAAIKPPGTKEG
jgi:hypothetical protein